MPQSLSNLMQIGFSPMSQAQWAALTPDQRNALLQRTQQSNQAIDSDYGNFERNGKIFTALVAGGMAAGGAYSALAAPEGGAAAAGTAGTAGTESAAGTAAGTAGTAATEGGSSLATLKAIATVLSPVLSIASSAASIGASKKSGQLNDSPVVAAPVTMPTAGSADTLNAMRSDIQEQITRRGRAATILTSPASETLGG